MKALRFFCLPSSLAAFAASVLIILFPMSLAKGEVVLSNLNSGTFQVGDQGNLGNQLNLNRAVSFQTNNSRWNITDFSFAAYNPTQTILSDFTIRLYAASSTDPYGPTGTAIYSASFNDISIPGLFSNTAPVTFSALNWEVEANTKYAIEVSMDSAPKVAFWARTDGDYPQNSWTHLSDLYNPGDWINDSAPNRAFSLSATAVPEPSTIVSFSLCVVGVLIWRFIGIAK